MAPLDSCSSSNGKMYSKFGSLMVKRPGFTMTTCYSSNSSKSEAELLSLSVSLWVEQESRLQPALVHVASSKQGRAKPSWQRSSGIGWAGLRYFCQIGKLSKKIKAKSSTIVNKTKVHFGPWARAMLLNTMQYQALLSSAILSRAMLSHAMLSHAMLSHAMLSNAKQC